MGDGCMHGGAATPVVPLTSVLRFTYSCLPFSIGGVEMEISTFSEVKARLYEFIEGGKIDEVFAHPSDLVGRPDPCASPAALRKARQLKLFR